MRAFMALETSNDVSSAVWNFQKALKEMGFYGSWPKRGNVHMTLFFFGEIRNEKVRKITKIMDEEISKIESFWMTLDKIGFFPFRGLPRVIWVGPSDGKLVKRVYDALNFSLEKSGFIFSKDFTPHVTVGRIKGVPKAWKEKAMTFEFEPIRFKCESVALFSSKLTPNGSIYEVIHRSKLGGLNS